MHKYGRQERKQIRIIVGNLTEISHFWEMKRSWNKLTVREELMQVLVSIENHRTLMMIILWRIVLGFIDLSRIYEDVNYFHDLSLRRRNLFLLRLTWPLEWKQNIRRTGAPLYERNIRTADGRIRVTVDASKMSEFLEIFALFLSPSPCPFPIPRSFFRLMHMNAMKKTRCSSTPLLFSQRPHDPSTSSMNL